MRAWIFALGLVGCGFSTAGQTSQDAPIAPIGEDAAVDVISPDAPPDVLLVDPVCLGTFVQVCVQAPQIALTLNTQRIDTTSSPMCAQALTTPATDACVIVGAKLTIPEDSTITVVGSRPLVLLSTRELTVAGTLDVSSDAGRIGPAADTGPCATDANNATPESGGGFGGSFGGGGNSGGNSPAGGRGGTAASLVNAVGLTGGCAGGGGANNGFGVAAGPGGHSGGAVLLLAEQTITVDGTINASGSGGRAGGQGFLAGGGGGGGGSGGMIVLEASSVNVAGACFANGGGGGGGGASDRGGKSGGESERPDEAAAGGGSSSTGGAGGKGAFGTTGALPGNNGGSAPFNAGGAGAGGGGVGIIKVIAPQQDGTDDLDHVAPPPR